MALTLSLNVQSYGARGNGVADDTVAVQAAITAASVSGGIVFFPAGTYLCNLSQSVSGLLYALAITGDNITLMGVPGASVLLTTTANVSTLHVSGSGKPAGILAWAANRLPNQAVLAISPATRGQMSVTCATPAEASGFAVGDVVYLRTGQTLAGLTGQPDAELNEVATVNVGTGVLGLRSPLAKDYAQEYFISGTTGRTSPAVTANLAIFGIVNATPRVLRNVAVLGLTFQSSAGVAPIIGEQLFGWTVEGCVSDSQGEGFISLGCSRFVRYRHNRAHVRGTGAKTFSFPVDGGTSDALIEGNVSTAEKVAYMHVHEGASRIRVVNNVFLNGPSAGDEPALQIRARAYDVTVEGNTFVGSGVTGVAFIDRDCADGGTIRGNRFRSTAATSAISSEASGWTIEDNDVGDLPIWEFAHHIGGYPGARRVQTLSTWVADDHQTQTLGTVPQYVEVRAVRVQVTEAFNSGGTDTLTVGHDANPSAYAASVDVSSTGQKTVPLGAEAGLVSTARTAKVYYTAGGSAPTTGKALVTLDYVPVGFPIG